MTFHNLLQTFAMSITENFASHVDAQAEDQLKAPFVQLLQQMGDGKKTKIIARTEARLQDAQGRPDIGVSVNNLLAGYIELKAPGFGSNPSRLKGDQNKKQWENFKSIPNLIYTDGNEWSLYRSGEKVGQTVRLDGDITQDGAGAITEKTAGALENLMFDFLNWEPIVPHNPRELAKFLAPLALFLRKEVTLALEDEQSALTALAHEWRGYLFPEADDHQFADAYAQTLTYALLLAKVNGAQDLSPENASRALETGNSLLGRILSLLAHPDAKQEIAVGYDLLERSISALDAHEIMKRNPNLWLYFYEDFLAAYDSKLRNDYGVYYTPVEVVQCQIHLISELLKDKFGKRLSFADDGVTFLDPAVGTGTYLVAAIQHALGIVKERSGEGAVPARASLIAKNMYAFEYLIGPYAVAHLRLSQEIMSEGGTLPDGRLQVYLADTLESPYTTPHGALDLTHRRLVEERSRAREVKESKRVLVCLGNPPYDRQTIEQGDTETGRKGGWVRFGDPEAQENRPILEDFLQPARAAGQGGHLKNLYNDYVYFWRWALWKLFDNQDDGGIISFITASSYLTGPGFVGMREAMRRTFDDLYIINLEGDNLGARKTDNVFNIQTPVAIAIGFCDGAAKRVQPANVYYAKITGTRTEKLKTLATITKLNDFAWQRCPTDWHDTFLPKGQGDYFAWPKLTDIFPWQHSGAQFKRRWPIAETKEVLQARWKALLMAETSNRGKLFYETRDRKISKKYTSALPGSGQSPLVDLSVNEDMPTSIRYAFRSFDRQWAIYDVRVGDYLKPDLYGTHSNNQIYMNGLQAYALGSGPAITVTAFIPDMHHFRGSFGGGDVIPLWRNADATEPNITRDFLHILSTAYGRSILPEDLACYCYGILANPGYAERFWEELSTPGPHVPITKDADLFQDVTALGRRLIWLHTYGERMAIKGEGSEVPIGQAKSIKPISEAEADYPEAFSYDPIAKQLHVGKGIFGPVAEEIWKFEVSGLTVLRSWLSYRMKSGAGKKSSPLDDIRPKRWTAQMTDELLELLWVLEHSISLYLQLQAKLEDVVAGACFPATGLPRPSDDERKPPDGAETDHTSPDGQHELFG